MSNFPLTLESLSDWLRPNEASRRLLQASKLPAFVTFAQLAHPLVAGLEHNIRMPFHHQGKEKGTTLPLMLYLGLKIKLMIEMGIREETVENSRILRKQSRRAVRQLMIDMYAIKLPQEQRLDVSKTLQAKIFSSVVYGESLAISDLHDVYLKSGKTEHAAHQISGTNTPSITIQHFLCTWLLRRSHLHENTSLNAINSTLRQVAKLVHKTINVCPMSVWEQDSGFSRRVQNAVLMAAFSESFAQPIADFVLANPYSQRV